MCASRVCSILHMMARTKDERQDQRRQGKLIFFSDYHIPYFTLVYTLYAIYTNTFYDTAYVLSCNGTWLVHFFKTIYIAIIHQQLEACLEWQRVAAHGRHISQKGTLERSRVCLLHPVG